MGNTCKKAGRYWFIVDNIKSTTDNPKILFWAALPINHKGQNAKIISISPEPYEIIEDDKNHNQIVFWEYILKKNEERVCFYYDFEIEHWEVNSNIDLSKIENYDEQSSEFLNNTTSEPWVEITPEIKEMALEIVGQETNPYIKANKFFNWVINNIDYEYPDLKERGSGKSFKKRKGDCGDFSAIFCAFCRSVKIPARLITCRWFQGSGHVWAEFYLPKYGWIPVDTSIAESFLIKSRIYNYESPQLRITGLKDTNPSFLFGNLYPNRLIVYRGINSEIISSITNIKKTFKFMQPGGSYADPKTIEFQGISDKVVFSGGGVYIFNDNKKYKDIDYAFKISSYEIADGLIDVQEWDKAKVILLGILPEYQNHSDFLFKLGKIYFYTNNLDMAIDYFTKTLSGKAGSIESIIKGWAYNYLGFCYDLKNDRALALTNYKKIIEMDIDFKDASGVAKRYIESKFTVNDWEKIEYNI